MVQYCLEMPGGAIRHFPAGTYNAQMANVMGRLELKMMGVAHAIWYAFKYLGPSKWGPGERKAAKLAEPVKPRPPLPTNRIDELISRLWPRTRPQDGRGWWHRRIIREWLK